MKKLMSLITIASILTLGIHTSIDISEFTNDIIIQYGHGKGI